MNISINDLLTLTGRLDDSHGFDTPRERFRRFLVEHAADVNSLRSLIDHCQYYPGEQHHRALQDLVVVLGRCLGFETTFGPYVRSDPAAEQAGHWRSRPGLHVVVEIRTGETRDHDLEGLSRAVVARATSDSLSVARILGLSVLAPLYAGRQRLEQALTGSRADVPLRIVSLRSLLTLADLVSTGRVTHDEAVRLFGSALCLDVVISMVERVAGAESQEARAAFDLTDDHNDRGFWIAVIAGDRAARPEEYVDRVIGKRHILAVGDSSASGAARPGDWIRFYIPRRGVVGRAQVVSIADNAGEVREAHRFSSLVHLDQTALHLDAPVIPDAETELRLRAGHPTGGTATPILIPITRREFMELEPRPDTATARRGGDVSAEDSRSHA